MRRGRSTWLVVAAAGLLGGCATHGPLLDRGDQPVELVDTPFYPQSTYQCGPAALAIALQASGVAATPDALVSQVYLPGRQGSLQIEMQGAPRRYDRVSYELDPDLAAITAELDAGRPVVVLHNYGLPFWPRWHYAVVIGYDPLHQKVVLRSGTTRREVQSAAHFMRAWENCRRLPIAPVTWKRPLRSSVPQRPLRPARPTTRPSRHGRMIHWDGWGAAQPTIAIMRWQRRSPTTGTPSRTTRIYRERATTWRRHCLTCAAARRRVPSWR
jgi:hypothetical protein